MLNYSLLKAKAELYLMPLLISYTVILVVFFFIPLTFVAAVFKGFSFFTYIEILLSFSLPAYVSGVLLVVIFGRMEGKNIGFIFGVVFSSLFLASCLFISYHFLINNYSPSSVGFYDIKIVAKWVIFIFLAGVLPAIFASLLFIALVARVNGEQH